MYLSPDEIAARAELGKALRRLHHAFVGRHSEAGELTVRYEAPVPLGVALEAKAWLTETVGRKQFVMAELRAGDVVVARCKATYINVAAPPSPT